MVYKDVIEQGLHLILPKRKKYTMKDVNKVYAEMFLRGEYVNEQRAKFITICTAIYHGEVECSRNVYKVN